MIGRAEGCAEGDDLRAGKREFVTFAPHVLSQDRQVKLASATDLETIRLLRFANSERDVLPKLPLQAVLEYIK